MAWSTGSSGGGGSTVVSGNKIVSTIAGRDAIKKPTEGMIAFVVDASDDVNVGNGHATYIYSSGQWILQTSQKALEGGSSPEEKAQLVENTEDIITIKDDVNTIQTDVTDVKSDITAINNNLTNTHVEVDNLKADNTKNKQDITDLKNDNQINKSEIQTLKDKNITLESTISDVSTSLSNKADVNHTHIIDDTIGLQNALDAKSDKIHTHAITEIDDLVDTLNGLRTDLDSIDLSSLSNIEITQVKDLQDVLNTLNTMLVNKSDEGHTHTAVEVTGISDQVEAILQSMGFDTANGQHTHTSLEITDFTSAVEAIITDLNLSSVPSAHKHEVEDVNGLQVQLDNKSDVTHTHQITDVAGLEAALQNVSGTAHRHDISGVNDLQTNLDGKANKIHLHTIPQVENLQTNLDTLTSNIANLASNKSDKTHTHKWDDIASKPTSTVAEIDNAVNSIHEHTNKTVIDQFEDASGILMYRGTPVGSEFITVDTIADRDAIPLDVRSEGMTVLIREDGSMYYLKDGVDNAFWTIFAVGAGGATNAATLPAIPSGNLTGVNAQSLFDQLESNKSDKDNTYSKVEVDDKFANQIIDYSTLDNLPDLTTLHKHENLVTLDKFGEYKGDLTWSGKTLGNMINDYYDADGDGLVDKAATLQGLTSTISELNFTNGLTGNIQSQLDALSSGTKFRGEFATFLDMTNAVGGEKGDWVFVLVDETQAGAKNTQYYHDGNEWIFGGGATKNPEATLTQSGVIKLGGVLSNPNSTATSPQLTDTGVYEGFYTTPNITVGKDGRITHIEANDVVFLNDTITSEFETWSSKKIDETIANKADKTHSHAQLHDADLLGKIRLSDVAPNDKFAIVYNATTGKAEWQRQQGGKVFVGSKFIEGDYTLKAGSYINLFVDDVTKEITINSTFRDGVNNGVPTLTEITESIVVPKGETVRFSSNAAFNKYMVNVIKVTNDEDCTMELGIYEQSEGGELEYLSNREYRTHDIMSLPIMDMDQTKKIHLSLTNYGVKDCTATVKIKTTNLV